MRISALSKQSGVPVATIKYYLREGLVPPGERTKVNQAEYGDEHVDRLVFIRGVMGVGRASIATIRDMLAVADTRPEIYCWRCGGPNVPWSAPSPLWNEVMRGGDINGSEIHNGIICPTCFAVLAQQAGIAELWRFHADRVLVPLQTVTPSGRTWNAGTWRWDDAPTNPASGLEPAADAPSGVGTERMLPASVGQTFGNALAEMGSRRARRPNPPGPIVLNADESRDCTACAHWRGLYVKGDDLEPRCDECGNTGKVHLAPKVGGAA